MGRRFDFDFKYILNSRFVGQSGQIGMNLPISDCDLNASGCTKCCFCGETNHVDAIQEIVSTGCSPDWFVRCESCNARGPWAEEERLAISFWNHGTSNSKSMTTTATAFQSQPPSGNGNAVLVAFCHFLRPSWPTCPALPLLETPVEQLETDRALL